ncbi:NC domain containing protein [Aphelenchoides avenae]|nr:NC domain containing protein [Aphelenchus avenae]
MSTFAECEVTKQLATNGCLLECDRTIGGFVKYRHWGVVLTTTDKRLEVVHYSDLGGSAMTRVDRFEVVVGSSLCRINNGFDAEHAPFDPEKIAQRARSRLGESVYNVALNNCEHFAHWCRYGAHRSEQVHKVIRVVGQLGEAAQNKEDGGKLAAVGRIAMTLSTLTSAAFEVGLSFVQGMRDGD